MTLDAHHVPPGATWEPWEKSPGVSGEDATGPAIWIFVAPGHALPRVTPEHSTGARLFAEEGRK